MNDIFDRTVNATWYRDVQFLGFRVWLTKQSVGQLILKLINNSSSDKTGCANLVRRVWFETPMKH